MLEQLSTHLFWDTPAQSIDVERHARWLIQRVLQRGRLSDWQVLLNYYGRERISVEVLKIRTLDQRTLHFLSTGFDLPIAAFRCSTTRPSFLKPFNS